MIKPHILFRFHNHFDICEQNLRLLRLMNPDVPIHGMYGGVEAVPEACAALLDTLYALPFEDKHYNWMHGDICVRWWHKQEGHKYDFTHLCVVEWDFVYLKSLDEIYKGFKKEGNYIAISGPYQELLDEDWPWIQGRFKGAIDKLKEDTGVAIEDLSFGIFGGCVLCRSFLDKLVERQVASYSNDEVRLSVYSYLFDVPLNDVGFLTDKKNIVCAFNSVYDRGDLIRAIKNGADVIHPIRVVIPDIQSLVGCSG